MKWVIDRFEEDWAVLEQSDIQAEIQMEEIPRHLMPKGAREGTTVYLQDGIWVIDHEDTAARKKDILARWEKLKKANGY